MPVGWGTSTDGGPAMSKATETSSHALSEDDDYRSDTSRRPSWRFGNVLPTSAGSTLSRCSSIIGMKSSSRRPSLLLVPTDILPTSDPSVPRLDQLPELSLPNKIP